MLSGESLYLRLEILHTAAQSENPWAKLCNYGVMTREPVEGFVYLFRRGLDCSAESVF